MFLNKIMGWRVIEISSNDHLKLYLNNLIIKRFDKKILININDIDVLLLDNYKINLSVQLVNAITRNNGLIIICNVNHEPSSFIYAVKGNHASLKVLEKQISWTNQYKGSVWTNIIKNKIHNQNKHLINIGKEDKKMFFDNSIKNIKFFDVTNREGHTAKVYWHLLLGNDFKRSYDSNECHALNSMLNYGYTLIRGMTIKSIIKKGLDPRIALFHKSFTNFFALASDLMEPFRILVDQKVYENRDSTIFTYEIKQKLLGILNEKVYINGKQEYINNALDKCMDSLIKGNGWLWVELWK